MEFIGVALWVLQPCMAVTSAHAGYDPCGDDMMGDGIHTGVLPVEVGDVIQGEKGNLFIGKGLGGKGSNMFKGIEPMKVRF